MINDYNIDRKTVILKIYFRAILKDLLAVLKIASGTTIAIIYLSESSFGTMKGLGYYISKNLAINNYNTFAGIFKSIALVLLIAIS